MSDLSEKSVLELLEVFQNEGPLALTQDELNILWNTIWDASDDSPLEEAVVAIRMMMDDKTEVLNKK